MRAYGHRPELLYPARTLFSAYCGRGTWQRIAAADPVRRCRQRGAQLQLCPQLYSGQGVQCPLGAGTCHPGPLAAGARGRIKTDQRTTGGCPTAGGRLRGSGAAARAGGRSCTAVLRPVQRADLTAERCLCVYLPQPQTATGQCERATVLCLFPAGQRLRRCAGGCRAGPLCRLFAPCPSRAAQPCIGSDGRATNRSG